MNYELHENATKQYLLVPPYEAPVAPEIVADTTNCSPAGNADKIIKYLIEKGFLLEDSEKKNF